MAWYAGFLVSLLLTGSALAQDPFGALFGDASGVQEVGGDDFVLVSLELERLLLADALPAHRTKEGLCLETREVFDAVEAPLQVSGDRLAGWFLEPANRIDIDLTVADGAVKTEVGWCLTLSFLSDVLQADFLFREIDLTVVVETFEIWPVEARMERKKAREAAARRRPAEVPDFPEVENPMRWLRFHAADVSLRSDLNGDGAREQLVAAMTGDVAKATGFLQASVSDQDEATLTFRLEKAFAGSVRAEAGDIALSPYKLLTRGGAGRGLRLTNTSPAALDSFDTTVIDGPLPAGWEAELHDPNGILAFQTEPDQQGRYRFEEVPLEMGYNRFLVKLFGPLGEVEERTVRIFVGEEAAPENELRWDIGIVEVARPLAGPAVSGLPEATEPVAVADLRYGISDRLSLGLAGALSEGTEGQLRTGVDGSLLGRSVSLTTVTSRGANPAYEARLRQLFENGRQVSLRYVDGGGVENDAIGEEAEQLRQLLTVSATGPLRFVRLRTNASLAAATENRKGGLVRQTAAASFAGQTGALSWRQGLTGQWSRTRTGEMNETVLSRTIVAGRVGQARFRSMLDLPVSTTKPSPGRAAVDLQLPLRGDTRGQLGVASGLDGEDLAIQGSLSRGFGSLAVFLGGELTDDQWRLGTAVRFSVRREGAFGLRLEPHGLTQSSAARIRTFEDRDADGVFGPNDRPIEGARFSAARSLRKEETAGDGTALISRLRPNSLIPLELQRSSLDDPFLKPAEPGRGLRLRPGQVIDVDIPVRPTGEAEIVVRTRRKGVVAPIARVPVQAVDQNGRVVATTQSAYDGYAYLADLPLGPLTFRIDPEALEGLAGRSAPLHAILSEDAPSIYDADLLIDFDSGQARF